MVDGAWYRHGRFLQPQSPQQAPRSSVRATSFSPVRRRCIQCESSTNTGKTLHVRFGRATKCAIFDDALRKQRVTLRCGVESHVSLLYSKMRRSTIRKAVLALCVLSYGLFCVSPKFAFSPSFIVLSLLWYRHLPSRRRTVRSFCRYWSLVAAPLLWAVFLGGWLDKFAAGTLGPPPIPFVFLLPWGT